MGRIQKIMEADPTEPASPAGTDGVAQPARRRRSKLRDIEDWLADHYIFRQNMVNTKIEYVAVNDEGPAKWSELTNRMLSSLWRQLDADGIETKEGIVYSLLKSDFVPQQDPILEYFQGLRWDGHNHIADLSGTVQTNDPDNWPALLRRWLLATAANATTLQGCQNPMVLIFTGGEGKGKSSWFRNLLPADLAEYFYEDKLVDPTHKDVKKLLAFKMLISLEETIGVITDKSKADALKAMLSQDSVEIRFEHERLYSRLPRRASFCATTNKPQFLTADAGDRRYLPFEILEINWDVSNKINYPQVWAQAAKAAKKGERYIITYQDLEMIQARNAVYHMPSREEECISLLYVRPQDVPPSEMSRYIFKTVSATEIATEIFEKFKFQAAANKIGQYMKKAGFEVKQVGPKNNRRPAYLVAQPDPVVSIPPLQAPDRIEVVGF